MSMNLLIMRRLLSFAVAFLLVISAELPVEKDCRSFSVRGGANVENFPIDHCMLLFVCFAFITRLEIVEGLCFDLRTTRESVGSVLMQLW